MISRFFTICLIAGFPLFQSKQIRAEDEIASDVEDAPQSADDTGAMDEAESDTASVNGAEGETFHIVIGVSASESRDFSVLETSLRTQFSDIDVTVRADTLDAPVSGFPQPEMTAKSLADQGENVVVVLIEGASFSFYVKEGESLTVWKRTIPTADSWEDSCDATATMVRSIFDSWRQYEALNVTFEKQEPPAPPPPKEDKKEEPKPAPAPPPPPPPPPKKDDKFSFAVGMDASYDLHLLLDREPVQHGGHAGLIARLTPYVRIDVGVDQLQFLKWRQMGWRFTHKRTAIRAGVSGQWSMRWLTIGLGAAFVSDMTSMEADPPTQVTTDRNNDSISDGSTNRNDPIVDPNEGLPRPDSFEQNPYEFDSTQQTFGGPSDGDEENPPEPPRADDGKRPYFGIGAMVYIAFQTTSWLDIHIAGGCDFYLNAEPYHINDNEISLDYRMVQPRFLAGLTFWFINR